jgi:hypothetical protein
MTQDRSKDRPRRTLAARAEEAAWAAFYRRAHDPAIAAELMQYLDSDAELKRAHAALYLQCRQSVRKQRLRQARAKRIGQFVRLVVEVVLLRPLAALARVLRFSGEIAVECLPATTPERATRQLRTLADEPDIAEKRAAFQQTREQDPSSNAKTG